MPVWISSQPPKIDVFKAAHVGADASCSCPSNVDETDERDAVEFRATGRFECRSSAIAMLGFERVMSAPVHDVVQAVVTEVATFLRLVPSSAQPVGHGFGDAAEAPPTFMSAHAF